jgi:DNA-binding response OmpR family regulator
MTQKPYKKFLSQQRILIADDSSVSRISIARGLTELGATSSLISLAESFDVAQALMNSTINSTSHSKEFTIVITEYDLGSHNGIELIQLARSKSNQAITAIITKNQSEAASAIAAENDVDVFLRKPFSMEILKKTFSDLIEDRTGSLDQTNPDRALDRAIEALQRSQDNKRIYDRTGYRALVHLFDSLISQGNKSDAYLVLRRLVTTFPLNPTRLSMILRLAVETRQWGDIDTYYSLFLEVDSRSDELTRHMYAALVSSGKAALGDGNLEGAMNRFKWASLTSGKKPAVLREIALALTEAGHVKEADQFVAAYPQHERQSIEFLTLDYHVMSKSQPLHLILQRGRELLKAGHEHPTIYEILIKACKSAGHHSEAESLALDAGRRWPAADLIQSNSEVHSDLPSA